MDWDKIGKKNAAISGAAKASKELTPPELPMEKIRAKDQVRKHFPNIEELAADVKVRGILQPITVIKDKDGDGYILHVGERRFRAAQLAGLKTIPGFVRPSQDEFKRIADQLSENIQREKLAPLEIARGLQQMKAENDISNRQLGEAVGKDVKYIGAHLALLRGPDVVTELLEARQLTDVDSADNLIKVFDLDEKLGLSLVERYKRDDPPTRAELRKVVKNLKSPPVEAKKKDTDGHAHHQPPIPFIATEKDSKAWKPRAPEKAEIRVKLSFKGVSLEGRMLVDRADEDDGKVWVIADDDTELRVPLKSLTILSVK